MGINAYLQDENGRVLDEYLDLGNVLPRLLNRFFAEYLCHHLLALLWRYDFQLRTSLCPDSRAGRPETQA